METETQMEAAMAMVLATTESLETMLATVGCICSCSVPRYPFSPLPK